MRGVKEFSCDIVHLDLFGADAHNRSMPIASNDPSPRDLLDRIASADDDAFLAIRELLICDDLYTQQSLIDDNRNMTLELIMTIYNLITALDTDAASLMRLDYSLCPLHHCDYAICFDDDNAECAVIRECFPSHDT